MLSCLCGELGCSRLLLNCQRRWDWWSGRACELLYSLAPRGFVSVARYQSGVVAVVVVVANPKEKKKSPPAAAALAPENLSARRLLSHGFPCATRGPAWREVWSPPACIRSETLDADASLLRHRRSRVEFEVKNAVLGFLAKLRWIYRV